jgi:hypothetical protein
LYLWSLGTIFAIEKFGQSATFDGVNRIIIKPGGVAGNNDVVSLVSDIIVMLKCGGGK